MSALPPRAGEHVICLGTSPAMLFEGLRHARAGARVTFLDRADDLGGGWRTRTLFGFAGVEVGAHLFENRPAVVGGLRSVMGEEELVVDEAGFGMAGARRVPLRAARALLYGGLTAKALARRDGDALAHSARNLVAAAVNWRTPLLYPRGGVRALLERLRGLLAAQGAVFRMGVDVQRIDRDSGEVVAHCEGTALRADRLILSSRAHAPVAGCGREWSGLRETRVHSLVMLFPPHCLNFSGYVELFSNSVIKRVRRLDMLWLPPDRLVAVFQARAMGADPAEGARRVIAEAARLGLLKHVVEPAGLHHECVTYRTLPARSLSRIAAQTKGMVATIQTVDFSDRRPTATL